MILPVCAQDVQHVHSHRMILLLQELFHRLISCSYNSISLNFGTDAGMFRHSLVHVSMLCVFDVGTSNPGIMIAMHAVAEAATLHARRLC